MMICLKEKKSRTNFIGWCDIIFVAQHLLPQRKYERKRSEVLKSHEKWFLTLVSIYFPVVVHHGGQ